MTELLQEMKRVLGKMFPIILSLTLLDVIADIIVFNYSKVDPGLFFSQMLLPTFIMIAMTIISFYNRK